MLTDLPIPLPNLLTCASWHVTGNISDISTGGVTPGEGPVMVWVTTVVLDLSQRGSPWEAAKVGVTMCMRTLTVPSLTGYINIANSDRPNITMAIP